MWASAPPSDLEATAPSITERTGKWMIFQDREAHDSLWETIKAETKPGGWAWRPSSHRATESAVNGKLPILVYTYDYNDQEDVMRVHDALRGLGITWPISYKADKDTLAGKYAAKGDRVSMYRN